MCVKISFGIPSRLDGPLLQSDNGGEFLGVVLSRTDLAARQSSDTCSSPGNQRTSGASVIDLDALDRRKPVAEVWSAATGSSWDISVPSLSAATEP